MNWFEGAKRIRLLLQVVWCLAVAVVGYVTLKDTSATGYYVTLWVDAPFYKMSSDKCDTGDAKEWIDKKTHSGTPVNIILCFAARELANGAKGVPYKKDAKDPSRAYVADSWRSEVSDYTKTSAANFTIPTKDEPALDAQYSKLRIEALGNCVLAALIGCFAIWSISATIGWVARGFVSKKL